MFKKIVFIVLLLTPFLTYAQIDKTEQVFKARVTEILDEQVFKDEEQISSLQQKLKLFPLEGEYQGKEVVFDGIGAFDVVSSNIYKKGDKVLVVASVDAEGKVNFYITDYVRSSGLFYLFILFVLVILAVGRLKGLRSVISLGFSFWVIIGFIIPRILSGANPISITILGSLLIILAVVYVTEGINKKAHIAVVSIFLSLFLTIILSWIFVGLTKLSGLGSEEIAYLFVLGGAIINFKGLLLAGIIIGTLGVLDDVVISQIALVDEIYKVDPKQNRKEVYKKAFKVGVTHISSMTNTLFLAYAGASLPLLVLFVSGESAFASFGQIINNEAIATEIVRTLTGSIGLILSVPIATGLAVFKNK